MHFSCEDFKILQLWWKRSWKGSGLNTSQMATLGPTLRRVLDFGCLMASFSCEQETGWNRVVSIMILLCYNGSFRTYAKLLYLHINLFLSFKVSSPFQSILCVQNLDWLPSPILLSVLRDFCCKYIFFFCFLLYFYRSMSIYMCTSIGLYIRFPQSGPKFNY